MHRALVAVVAAGAIGGPAATSLPPIVFSSTGSPDFVAPHWYAIGVDGKARRPLALPAGVLSPDGRLVARAGGTDAAPTVELVGTNGAVRTLVDRFPGPSTTRVLQIVWSPSSRRLAISVARACAVTPGKGESCGAYEIWSVNSDGSRLVRAANGRRPAWSSDSRELAYVRYHAPFHDVGVFVVRASGARERALVPGNAPVWAPHGTRIAYIAPRGLATVDVRDRRTKRVFVHHLFGDPVAWSPDGRQLAFAGGRAGSAVPVRLRTVDVGTGSVRVLAGSAGISALAWSADGRRIAYASGAFARNAQVFVVRSSGGASRIVTHEGPWAHFDALRFAGGRLVYLVHRVLAATDLYAVRTDGSGLVPVTHDPYDDLEPSWSPDGTRLVFRRRSTGDGYPPLRARGLYVLDATTRASRRIVPLAADPSWPSDPAWSPDGTEIAYTTPQRVVIVTAAGAPVTSFSVGANQASHPSWSPDGARLALSVGGSISNEIFVVNRDGTALRQLTHMPVATEPSWSPDGAWIAFAALGSGDGAYWIVAPDGTRARRVAAAATAAGGPAWSPDSTELVGVEPDGSLHAVRIDGSGDRLLVRGSVLAGMASPTWRR